MKQRHTVYALKLTEGLLVLSLFWALLLPSGPLFADEGHHMDGMGTPTIMLQLPLELVVGKRTMLQASLTGSGPLAGAEVVFLATVTFAGTEGQVELGRAITDDLGKAQLPYLPRTHGEITIAARFNGDGQEAPAEVFQVATIQPGPQLYQETAGVRIPVIGVWLLVAVLGVVWSTYLLVMIVLGRIALRGLSRQAVHESVPEGQPIPTLARELGHA